MDTIEIHYNITKNRFAYTQPFGRNGFAKDTGKSRTIALRFCEIRTKTTIVAR
jgi:hypothetical protein